MMPLRLLVPAAARVTALVISSVVACGPIKGDDTDGSTATTTDGMTATAADSEPTGGSGDPAVCNAPADPADPLGTLDVCDDYAAHEPGADIEVGFINNRNEAVIVLGGPACEPGYFSLQGQPGGRSAHWPYQCGLDPPICDELLAGDDGGCLLNCPVPAPIRIEPGGRFSASWAPLLAITTELPAGCAAEVMQAVSCTAGRRPTAAAYTLESFYVLASDCTGACSCEPGPDGWCTLEAFDLEVPSMALIGQGEYDGVCTVANIVIE